LPANGLATRSVAGKARSYRHGLLVATMTKAPFFHQGAMNFSEYPIFMTSLNAIRQLKENMGRFIVGQDDIIERLIIGLLSNGNLLVEGLPGLGKTRAIRTLAQLIDADFSRIQFTPDMLPSDVTGTEMMYNKGGDYKFRFEEGPIFGNIVLADEVNRAPAKVQSAMLEAMEERQVTIANQTHKLPGLFMVMATQNPIEQEGTYPLPEAQMDRFLLHVSIDYPDKAAEKAIIDLARQKNRVENDATIGKLSEEVIFAAREEIEQVVVSDAIKDYMVDLVFATRFPAKLDQDLAEWIVIGASPRATIAMDQCAKTHAWLNGRTAVTPEDIRAIAHGVLRHRITASYQAQTQGIDNNRIIDKILELVAISV